MQLVGVVNHGGAVHFRDEVRSEGIIYIGMHYPDAKLSE